MVNISVHSDLLSAFWSGPTSIRADVLLPDSYDVDPSRRYPVIYWFPGYGGQYDDAARKAWGLWMRAFAAEHREAIVVFPDPMFGFVYTEFADSANVGPWGDAFATEFIPYIDANFRTGARYVAGHSSGAWAALWQQVTHPELFDGAWAYAPDPVDFHDFTGPDLTATPPNNFYFNSHGPYYIDRVDGRDRMTLRDFVLGEYMPLIINQFESFNAVFSPRGADHLPEPLFNSWNGYD